MSTDNKPEYAKFGRGGRYGDMEYSYVEGFCEKCGYAVLYDGQDDDGSGTLIHMGLDGAYRNKCLAEFDLARKLACRIYKKASSNPEYFVNYGLPKLEATDSISEEMIINTWANFITRYAFLREFHDWSL